MSNFNLYLIEFSDGYLYTGITNDLSRRISEHSSGLCNNTKNRLPITKIYSEKFTTRIEAANREKEIKGWRREKKNNLFK